MVSTLSTHVTYSPKERLPHVWPSPTVFWAGHYLSMHAHSDGVLKQSIGARNRVGIGLSYRPTRLNTLAELISWNRYLGSLKVWKFGLRLELTRPRWRKYGRVCTLATPLCSAPTFFLVDLIYSDIITYPGNQATRVHAWEFLGWYLYM